jgi:hypothetical protein
VPYNPTDRISQIAGPDSPLEVFLTDNTYKKEAIRAAADKVAFLQETQGQDLLENKYTFYNKL